MTKWLALLLTLSAVQAQASSNEDVVIVKKNIVYENTSEHNRIGKRMTLSWTILGVGPLPLISASGLSAAFFLDRNSQVVVDYNSGEWKGFLFEGYDIKGRSLGVHYKKFNGNSFYYRAGVDYRDLNYRYRNGTLFKFNDEQREIDGNSLAVSFAIGNQWQWSGFTMGCDWIGLTAPISRKITRAEQTGTSLTAGQKQAFEEDKAYLFSSSTAQLLRFYIGGSF